MILLLERLLFVQQWSGYDAWKSISRHFLLVFFLITKEKVQTAGNIALKLNIQMVKYSNTDFKFTRKSSITLPALEVAVSGSVSLFVCVCNQPLDATSLCKFSGGCPKISCLGDRCWYYLYLPTSFKSHMLQMVVEKTLSWQLFLRVKYNNDRTGNLCRKSEATVKPFV